MKNAKNNVSYLLELNAKKHPDKIIFYWVDQKSLGVNSNLKHNSITYTQFVSTSSRIGAGLTSLGIKKGDRIIIFIPISVNLYLIMSALQRIGAVPVFLDSWTRHIHLKTCVDQVKPKAIVSFERAFQLIGLIPKVNRILLKISVGEISQKYDASLEELIDYKENSTIKAVEKEDTALITFTTGSSGEPKGADRSHRFLAAQHYALEKCVPYNNDDIDLPIFPVFSLNNVASGISTVIPAIDIASPNPTDSSILFKQIQSCKVNCATLSPSVFRTLSAFCQENKLELKGLKRVITGGAPISQSDIKNFKLIAKDTEIVVLYGSTEVEPISKIIDREILATLKVDKNGVNVGKIVDGLEYKVIKIEKGPIQISSPKTWKNIELKKGEVGELIVTGDHVCQKYYNNPAAFKSSKIVDFDGKIWHRTGDLVRTDKTGSFWIVGRVHNVIVRKGKNYFPVSAELILKNLPFVSQAAYLGLPDGKLGEKSTAVIELKDKKELPETNKRGFELTIKGALEKNELPVDLIYFLENIPMDPRHRSKVEYNLLRKQLLENEKKN